MINIPTYKLAKFIDTIIKSHIPKTHCVENNRELKKKHKEGHYCISFDVVSLITDVPLNGTIEMIFNKVPESEISKKSLTNLLKSVTGGLFQHNSKLYTQIDRSKHGKS